MREESESVAEFHLYATLAALPVFWAVMLFVLSALLPEQILAMIGLDMELSIGVGGPLLVVGGLMLERAFAARGIDASGTR